MASAVASRPQLPRSSGSAYGNPQPYDTVAMERFGLFGRLKVQASRATRAAVRGDGDNRARALAVCDELLDHWLEADARARSAAMELAEFLADQDGWPVGRAVVDRAVSHGRVS